jgi:ABC-2 type transport system permease protein
MNPPAPAAISGSAGLRDLRFVRRQLHYEQLSFWLNPVGAVFTIGFSVVFLVMLGATVGRQRVSYLGNIQLVQYYVPGFVAYGVMAACFTILAISLVNRREMGLLKRLRLSPLPVWALLSAIFLSTLVVALIQVVILLAVGRLAFGVHLPGNFAAFGIAILIGVLSFTALGVAMSTVIPNADSSGPLISTVFFVLLFLSGFWFPIQAGTSLAKIASWFPVHHFTNAVFASFKTQGKPWAWHDLLVLALWGAGGCVIAVWRFRWAPRVGVPGGGRRPVRGRPGRAA